MREYGVYYHYADAIREDLNGTGGYQIKVNIASHVFGNNESERWYDRVLTRPWDRPAAEGGVTGQDKAKGQEPSRSSAYYQVYDLDHFEGEHTGFAATGGSGKTPHIQPFGMDHKYTLQRWYRNGPETQLAGSPNMPTEIGRASCRERV